MTPIRQTRRPLTLDQQFDAMRFIVETEQWLTRMEAACRTAQIAFASESEIETVLAAAYGDFA